MYNESVFKIITNLINRNEYNNENFFKFKEDLRKMYGLYDKDIFSICLIDYACIKAEKDYNGNIDLVSITALFDKLLLSAKNFK